MYKIFANIIPKKIREKYMDMLTFCDIKVSHEDLIGFIVSFGAGLSLFIAINLLTIFFMSTIMFIFTWLMIYFLFEIAIYMRFWLIAEKKANMIDYALPDALEMMSMNLKAGLTVEKAFIASTRPEFGPLEEEFRKAANDMLVGRSLREALMNISIRNKSGMLSSTMNMISQGIDSGGELSDLLEETAEDIRQTKAVQKEVRANVMMYVFFIFFAAAIGAPVIFGISTYLVEVMQTQFDRYDFSEVNTGNIGLNIGGGNIGITPDFLVLYTVASLLITSIFGGMIIGIIKSGKETSGVKFIPILFIISVGIFFAVRMFIASMFVGL